MIENSLSQQIEKLQQLRDKEVYQMYIYCPMCEIEHINNTFCQMPWSDQQ